MSRRTDSGFAHERSAAADADLAQRKRPRQARSVAMVEALKQAAARILDEEGREALSLSRLSEYAGVSVSSIYEYFPTLEALISTIFDDRCAQQQARLLDAIHELPAESTLYDGLLLILRCFLQLRREQWAFDQRFNARYLQHHELQRLETPPSQSLDQARVTRALMQRFAADMRMQDAEKTIFLAYHSMPALTRVIALERPEYLEQDDTAEMLARMLHALLGRSDVSHAAVLCKT